MAAPLSKKSLVVPDTYADAKAIHDMLHDAYDRTAKALGAIPGVGTGPMGLTPDAVKATPEFRQAHANFHRVHETLRAFNRPFLKRYRREYQAELMARRAARAAEAATMLVM